MFYKNTVEEYHHFDTPPQIEMKTIVCQIYLLSILLLNNLLVSSLLQETIRANGQSMVVPSHP